MDCFILSRSTDGAGVSSGGCLETVGVMISDEMNGSLWLGSYRNEKRWLGSLILDGVISNWGDGLDGGIVWVMDWTGDCAGETVAHVPKVAAAKHATSQGCTVALQFGLGLD